MCLFTYASSVEMVLAEVQAPDRVALPIWVSVAGRVKVDEDEPSVLIDVLHHSFNVDQDVLLGRKILWHPSGHWTPGSSP